MGFDSKREFTSPTIFVGASPLPLNMEHLLTAAPVPSYWGFPELGRGVSPHHCSSEAQPWLLTLDMGESLDCSSNAVQVPLTIHTRSTKHW